MTHESTPKPDGPLVSIVTPSLNQGAFIQATIESVLGQDYANIEYIVIDGGSTDDTLQILDTYDDHVNWTSEPDRNQSNAINKGLGRSRGSILTWLNSDDTLKPNAVSRVVEEFSSDDHLGLVYGAGDFISESGQITGEALSLEPDLWRMVFLADHVPQPSAFFRRSALDEVGPIDESLRYCLDYEFFIRLFVNLPVRRIPDVLSSSRVYDRTISSSGGLKRYQEIVEMVRHHSGMQRPPAMWNYRIDLLEHTLERYLHRLLGKGAVAGAVLRKSHRIAIKSYRTIMTHSNSVWPDGWVGREATFLVRRRDGDFLDIEGEVPGRNVPEEEQELEIRVDGDLVDRAVLPVGDFRLVYALTPSLDEREPGERAIDQVRRVEIRAAWSVDSRKVDTATSDGRDLSWRATVIRACRHLSTVAGSIGWFEDQWASRVVTIFVVGRNRRIRLRGRLPAEFPELHGQIIRIEVDGQFVHERGLEIGKFEIAVSSSSEEISVIRVRAVKWLDERSVTRDGGVRWLSYLLYEIIDDNNELVVATLRR